MAITAIKTRFSGIDPNTGSECHKPSHHKTNMRSAYRNKAKAYALGLHIAAGLLDPRTGEGNCSACNGLGTMALLPNNAAGMLTLELAHDIPQSQGGALCYCSMTLQHRLCNMLMDDMVQLNEFNLYHDAREYAARGNSWSSVNDGFRQSFNYEEFISANPSAYANVNDWRAETPLAHAVQQRVRRA